MFQEAFIAPGVRYPSPESLRQDSYGFYFLDSKLLIIAIDKCTRCINAVEPCSTFCSQRQHIDHGIDKRSGGRKIKCNENQCNEAQCNKPALGNGMNYCSHQYETDPPDVPNKTVIPRELATRWLAWHTNVKTLHVVIANSISRDLVRTTSVIPMDA
ncbi:hypothetical protein BOTNAR_0965g00020 [Botryotinia narcissicola]|uniref:Uncharacterized protein n=1 Tax=Botryotinia narcissicola TaxID=278944 RepID=A0A4Z1H670_9HELO|nr:hypothetical protein BOTNAR_0965g00020 [Botryotinia narcissicola]